MEAHIEIALALSRGDAKAALSGAERLLRYVESRIGQIQRVGLREGSSCGQPDRFLPPSKTVMPAAGSRSTSVASVRRAIVM